MKWKDIVTLFAACGGSLEEMRGSRMCVEINGLVAYFHRLQPENRADLILALRCLNWGNPSKSIRVGKYENKSCQEMLCTNLKKFLN